jgi:hypothetical protein
LSLTWINDPSAWSHGRYTPQSPVQLANEPPSPPADSAPATSQAWSWPLHVGYAVPVPFTTPNTLPSNVRGQCTACTHLRHAIPSDLARNVQAGTTPPPGGPRRATPSVPLRFLLLLQPSPTYTTPRSSSCTFVSPASSRLLPSKASPTWTRSRTVPAGSYSTPTPAPRPAPTTCTSLI